MVKIKTIKKMNLPELIQWGWDNDITFKTFFGSRKSTVYFDRLGQVSIYGSVPIYKTFEVEIEEEITEETVITNLIEVYKYDRNTNIHLNKNMNIKKVLHKYQSDPLYVSKDFYILNDDMTMTLIWKDGEMVE